MQIQTSRFGAVEIDESRIIRLPRGLVGFDCPQSFALIQTTQNATFFWLQSIDQPELAFVVCDPRTFVPDYRVMIKAEELALIERGEAKGSQVLVIVNKVNNTLTGNLQGPLVINPDNLMGIQLVLSDKRYTTRHVLLELPARRGAASRTA